MNSYIEQIAKIATNEIYVAIKETQTNGNYWINSKWNIFVELGYIASFGKVKATYYCVNLEEYQDNGEIVEVQVDYEDTETQEYTQLYCAILNVIKRNKERILKCQIN